MKGILSFKTVYQTFLSNISIQIITIVQGIILARVLGVEGRGEFAAIILWPTLFASICQFGIKSGVSIIAAKFNPISNLYLSSLLSALITGVIGFAISVIAIPLLLKGQNPNIISLATFYSIFVVINHLSIVLLSIEHGRGDFKRYNILRLILNPIYIGLIGMLYFFNKLELENLIYALLVANLLVLFIRIFLIIRNVSFKEIYPVKMIFKKSFSFGIADLIMPLYLYLDKGILLWFLGVSSLGLYTVAFSSASAIGSVSAAIATVGFAQVAQDKGNVKSLIETFRLNTIVFLIVGVFYSISLFVLIPLVYGDEFGLAIWPAIVLVLAVFFQGQGNILEQALRGDSQPYKGIWARGVSLLIMFFLGFLLSRKFGLLGICVAFVIAQSFFMIMLLRMFKENFHINESFLPKTHDFRTLLLSIKTKLKI